MIFHEEDLYVITKEEINRLLPGKLQALEKYLEERNTTLRECVDNLLYDSGFTHIAEEKEIRQATDALDEFLLGLSNLIGGPVDVGYRYLEKEHFQEKNIPIISFFIFKESLSERGLTFESLTSLSLK